MRRSIAAFAVALLAVAAVAGAQEGGAQGTGQAPPPEPAAKRQRVATDLTSFEMLAPEELAKRTTVAAGTRGLVPPPPEPIAPYLGRSLSTRPTLSWAGRDTAVKVVVADRTGAEVLSRDVAGNRLDWGDAPALQPGQTYTWSIEAGHKRSSEASFEVLDGEERQAVEEALAAVPGEAIEAQVERARVLAWRGVWYDALAAYDAVVAAHPDRAELYRERAGVLASIPRGTAAAEADLARAAELESP